MLEMSRKPFYRRARMTKRESSMLLQPFCSINLFITALLFDKNVTRENQAFAFKTPVENETVTIGNLTL